METQQRPQMQARRHCPLLPYQLPCACAITPPHLYGRSMPFANRSEFLDAIARDLGDPDAAIWNADDLSRHLGHALANLADAAGAEDSQDVPATGSASYDLSWTLSIC